MVRLVVCPPRKRTCRWIRSVLLMVTSSMSRRAMRLRSRWGVAGSVHRVGKSVARAADARFVFFAECGLGGGGGAFVVVLGGLSTGAGRRSSRPRGCRPPVGCRGRRPDSGGGRLRRGDGLARRGCSRSASASSARVSSSAWTVSATSRASGVTVSSRSWPMAGRWWTGDEVQGGTPAWMACRHAAIAGDFGAAPVVIARRSCGVRTVRRWPVLAAGRCLLGPDRRSARAPWAGALAARVSG